MARAIPALDLVEAAYELGASDDAWLAQVLDAARGHFDRGSGLFVSVYSESDPSQAERMLADDPNVMRLSGPLVASLPAHVQRYFLETSHYDTLRAILRRLDPEAEARWLEIGAAFGVRDAIGLVAHDLEGRSIQLCGASSQDEVVRPETARTWTRVAAHLGAALRLRRRRERILDDLDAVLTPSGRLEHASDALAASPAMREALEDAVKRRERARVRSRAHEHESLASWPVLVKGRFSLVDSESPGRGRRILAPRNAPRLPPVMLLSPTQRTMTELVRRGLSNKQIAYALGVSEGHVASTLHEAMRRLGVRSRVGLVQATKSGVSDASRAALESALSPAEAEVAWLALQGASHREIAAARGVSERTVANQLAHVYRTFGVRSKSELAARLGRSVVPGDAMLAR